MKSAYSQFGGVSPNRRKFRQAKSWPRCAPHGQTFRISGQKRKARTPPRASGRVPSHRIAPRQPSKTGKFPLARGLAGRNSAWRNFRRLGLTTPSTPPGSRVADRRRRHLRLDARVRGQPGRDRYTGTLALLVRPEVTFIPPGLSTDQRCIPRIDSSGTSHFSANPSACIVINFE
jgi:hypothetical protein